MFVRTACGDDRELQSEVESLIVAHAAAGNFAEAFAQDADRVARLEREATLLASLNHPNIATIHGLEADHGTRFLVLELVEGRTLADRLRIEKRAH